MERIRIAAFVICVAAGLFMADVAQAGHGRAGGGNITIFHDGFGHSTGQFRQPNSPYSHDVPSRSHLRPHATPTYTPRPLIQIALLLDTSGTMTGLIRQARAELWQVVNGLVYARRDAAPAVLMVALYEYGNNLIGKERRYVRQVVPFTPELDWIGAELFGLKAAGGTEHCGRAIMQAVTSLNWSSRPGDLKLLIIAGNESFAHGPVDYQDACLTAASRGIIVNTIHCGTHRAGAVRRWQDAADLTGGSYAGISHNYRIRDIATPHDIDILALSRALNETYIPYGSGGDSGLARQNGQDRSLDRTTRAAAIQRVVTKASRYYRNDSWDLVDAIDSMEVDMGRVRIEELPAELRRMSRGQIAEHVKSMALRREQIRQQIWELNDRREEYIAKRDHGRLNRPNTLGQAILQAVLEQGRKRNFQFGPPEETDAKPQGPGGTVIMTWQGRDRVHDTRYRIISAWPIIRR